MNDCLPAHIYLLQATQHLRLVRHSFDISSSFVSSSSLSLDLLHLAVLFNQLSTMESDVVAQFTEITGSTPELATQYLSLADFQIEQAMQLYFENGGAPLTEEPARPSRPSNLQDESGVVQIDSDTDDDARPAQTRPAQAAGGPPFEDDAAMARRLQEEMYGERTAGDEDEVRAPMARTTETLVGPEADFDDDMHSHILNQLRARRGGI